MVVMVPSLLSQKMRAMLALRISVNWAAIRFQFKLGHIQGHFEWKYSKVFTRIKGIGLATVFVEEPIRFLQCGKVFCDDATESGLSAANALAMRLCSRIHRVCITVNWGCSLTRESPAKKQALLEHGLDIGSSWRPVRLEDSRRPEMLARRDVAVWLLLP